jgi:anthranilate synthase/aminodeoxychorismate synthase-like glutamine amidotransferase
VILLNGPKILLIDALDSFTYNLVQAFETLGAEVRVVRHDVITLEEAKALHPEAVVLSPGPGHPTESPAHMALAGSDWDIPLLGVCLGHQALAAATGGRVTRALEPLHGEATPLEHDGSGPSGTYRPASRWVATTASSQIRLHSPPAGG